jgi:hypothetical protein
MYFMELIVEISIPNSIFEKARSLRENAPKKRSP